MRIFELLKKDRWIRPFLKKYNKSMILAFFLGFMTFFCAGGLLFDSGFLISKSASLPENILLVFVPIVLARAFGIGRPVFRYLERLTSHNWVLKLTSELRLKLYNILEKGAVFLKENHQTGDILGLLSEDIDHIQNLYMRTVFPTVIAWVLYIVIVIALGFFSIPFALLMLLLIGVMTVILPLVSVIFDGMRQEKRKFIKNNLYTNLTDNVLGVSDWVFSQHGKKYVQQHDNKELKLRKINHKINHYNNLRDLVTQLIIGFIIVVLVIWAAYKFPGNHGGLANWIAAFVLVVFPLSEAFSPLSSAAEETNVYKDSLARLNNLSDSQKPVFKNKKKENKLPLLSFPYKILINKLSFRYPTGKDLVLRDLNLSFEQGQKVAILGRSGSGKTTLIHLLRGDLKPLNGTVLLNGVSTFKFGDKISNYIGVINQKPYLFRTTIRNNLRIGNEKVSDNQIWKVLERVGLSKMVMQLPSGLSTMVDEAGYRFSGGERHRMALARILLQDVPIIILDEPTVGLDPMTEQSLIEIFVKELAGKTLIWVTHHLQGLSLMNRVVFIEDGQLQMSGNPKKLAQKNPRYQKLLQIDHGNFANRIN